jgi:hypothetical protein
VPEIFVGYVENPFKFMHLINMSTRTNFFEKTSTEYSLHGVYNDVRENSAKEGAIPSTPKKAKVAAQYDGNMSLLLMYFDKLARPVFKKYRYLKDFKTNFLELYMDFVWKLNEMEITPPELGGCVKRWRNAAHECALLSMYDFRFSYLAALMLDVGNVGCQATFNASQFLIEEVFQSFMKNTNTIEEEEDAVNASVNFRESCW